MGTLTALLYVYALHHLYFCHPPQADLCALRFDLRPLYFCHFVKTCSLYGSLYAPLAPLILSFCKNLFALRTPLHPSDFVIL